LNFAMGAILHKYALEYTHVSFVPNFHDILFIVC